MNSAKRLSMTMSALSRLEFHPTGLSRTALVTRRRDEQGVRSWDTEAALNLPKVVTREEWLVARKQLLAREKELTRQRDQVNADRRRLPMVAIEKSYTFEGPDGPVGLEQASRLGPEVKIGGFVVCCEGTDHCRVHPAPAAGKIHLSFR